MGQRHARRWKGRLLAAAVILVSLLVFDPLVMMAMVSLKTNLELTTAPFGLPREFQWQNYADAFWGMDYPTAFRNSAVLTAISAAGCTLLAAVGAYAIVRVTHGRKLFVFFNAFFLLGLALPQQVAMVPMVLWLQKLGLGGSLLGVCLVYIAANAAYGVFFFSGFVATVPITLEEAAMIDGCGQIRAFFRIVFPMLKPITATVAIINILGVFNDFTLPLIMLSSQSLKTLPLSFSVFYSSYLNEWQLIMSGLVLSIFPVLVFFLLMQRNIMDGLTAGALKG